MKSLTEAQLRRLDAATTRVDEMVEKRPLHIADEDALTVIIAAMHAVVTRLEAGQVVTIVVQDEDGDTVASAPLALEPEAGR